jgi:hypothetical protein
VGCIMSSVNWARDRRRHGMTRAVAIVWLMSLVPAWSGNRGGAGALGLLADYLIKLRQVVRRAHDGDCRTKLEIL